MPQETNQPTALSRILKMLYLKTSHLDCGKKLDQVEFIRNVFYSYYEEKSKKKDEDDVGFPDKSVCSKMINGKIIAPGKLRVFYNSNPQKLMLDIQCRILLCLKSDDREEIIKNLTDSSPSGANNFTDDPNDTFSLANGENKDRQDAQTIACAILYAMEIDAPKQICKASEFYPDDRFPCMHNYVPKPCMPFLGREDDLGRLHAIVQKKKQVFLHGCPGYGKSELAKAYAHHDVYRQKYKHILYICYSGNLEKDIADLFFEDEMTIPGNIRQLAVPGRNALETVETTKSLYRKHLNYLHRLSEDDLLILDQFDALPFPTVTPVAEDETSVFQEEPRFPDLMQLPCRLLICTRCNFQAEPQYASHCQEVKELDEENLRKLVREFYPEESHHRRVVKKIILLLERNTLLVKLASILLGISKLEPEQLYQKLEAESLGADVPEHIHTQENNRYRSDTFANYAKTLFKLYLLKDVHRDVMRNMSLMPPAGVAFRLFLDWIGLDNADPIQELHLMGLINKDNKGKISMHPLIQQAVKEETSPSIDNCSVLLKHFVLLCSEKIGKNKENCPDAQNAIASISRNILKDGSSETMMKYLMFQLNAIPYCLQHSQTILAGTLTEELNRLGQNHDVPKDVRIVAKTFYLFLRNKPLNALMLFVIASPRLLGKMLWDGIQSALNEPSSSCASRRKKFKEKINQSMYMRIYAYGSMEWLKYSWDNTLSGPSASSQRPPLKLPDKNREENNL